MIEGFFLPFFFFPLLWGATFLFYYKHEKIFKGLMVAGSVLYVVLCAIFLKMTTESMVFGELLSFKMDHLSKISFELSFDGMRSAVILLNSLLLIIIILANWKKIQIVKKIFFFLLFLIFWAIQGALLAGNLLTFFIFWEIVSVLFFILYGIWSSNEKKVLINRYLLLSTISTLLLFLVIIFMSVRSFEFFGTYDLTPVVIKNLAFKYHNFWSEQSLIFIAISLSIFLKMFLFPFHGQLFEIFDKTSDITIVVVAIALINICTCFFVKFVIPVFTPVVESYSNIINILGVLGVVYGAFIALSSDDLKKIIVYTLVYNVSLIVIGLFQNNNISIIGAVYLGISMTITIAGLLVSIQILPQLSIKDSESIKINVGPEKPLFFKWYRVLFFILILGWICLPIAGNFIGNLLVIYSVFINNVVFGIFCVLSLGIYAIHLFYMFNKTVFHRKIIINMNDSGSIGFGNLLAIGISCLVMVALGIYPYYLIQLIGNSI